MTSSIPYLIDEAKRRFMLVESQDDSRCLVLGRAADCDIVVPDRRVSRHHAKICWDGFTALLHDLGSRNGTYLNGRRISSKTQSPVAVQNGNEIVLCGALFVFHDPDATVQEETMPSLRLDSANGEVWVNHQLISLSPKERILFSLLHRSSPLPCSKATIATVVWAEYETPAEDYQVESLVKRLREKLEPDPRNPVLILTVPSRGYKLILRQEP